MTIRILTTGGTIDKVYFDARSEFEVGESIAGMIFKESLVTADYEVSALMRKDSLEITTADRDSILAATLAASESKILITHGTDTMCETARHLLAGGVEAAGKTVVLTGALNPARFRSTDAIFNLGMALATAQLQPPGAYITMNGQVFNGSRVVKNLETNRFESTNDATTAKSIKE